MEENDSSPRQSKKESKSKLGCNVISTQIVLQ